MVKMIKPRVSHFFFLNMMMINVYHMGYIQVISKHIYNS